LDEKGLAVFTFNAENFLSRSGNFSHQQYDFIIQRINCTFGKNFIGIVYGAVDS
jgi:hypothetical protein